MTNIYDPISETPKAKTYLVMISRQEHGYAYIEADNQQEALSIAAVMDEDDYDWKSDVIEHPPVVVFNK